MQNLQNEFENLIGNVIKKRMELIRDGFIACGYPDDWMNIPENARRCNFVESEDVENGGFKTSCFVDNELIFEVICSIDHKVMDVISELRIIKKE